MFLGTCETTYTLPDVQTEENMHEFDIDVSIEECMSQVFNTYIQQIPSHVCYSCKKFLFPEKVKHLARQTNVSKRLCISQDCDICGYCWTKIAANVYPVLHSTHNLLDPGDIPSCLRSFTIMEKRLISKIHVFMTVIVLPGGKFAEKGMAIDLPVDIASNMKHLPTALEDSNVIIM